MKNHHVGPFGIEPFVACFGLVEAVELYETVREQINVYPASTQEHLQVQIDRPDAGGYMIRVFSSLEPKTTLIALSDSLVCEVLAS